MFVLQGSLSSKNLSRTARISASKLMQGRAVQAEMLLQYNSPAVERLGHFSEDGATRGSEEKSRINSQEKEKHEVERQKGQSLSLLDTEANAERNAEKKVPGGADWKSGKTKDWECAAEELTEKKIEVHSSLPIPSLSS